MSMVQKAGVATLAVFVFWAFGCGEEEANLAEPTDDSQQFLSEADGYQSWDTLGDGEPFVSNDHMENFVVTYGNDAAHDAVADAEEEGFSFPEGAIFIKEVMPEEDAEPTALDAMGKLSDDEGDWHWMKATPDRQKIIDDMQGDLGGCTGCHGNAGTDYVFLDEY